MAAKAEVKSWEEIRGYYGALPQLVREQVEAYLEFNRGVGIRPDAQETLVGFAERLAVALVNMDADVMSSGRRRVCEAVLSLSDVVEDSISKEVFEDTVNKVYDVVQSTYHGRFIS